jgi:hypothetical protein
MALGGLWHGAAWTFIAWGTYHGALLAIHRAWSRYAPECASHFIKANRPISVALTFLCVVVGWVLFRSPDFTTAATILRSMVGFDGTEIGHVSRHVVALIVLGLLACWTLPNVYQIFHSYRPALILRGQFRMVHPFPSIVRARFWPIEALAGSAAILLCFYVMRSSVSEFLYFMF